MPLHRSSCFSCTCFVLNIDRACASSWGSNRLFDFPSCSVRKWVLPSFPICELLLYDLYSLTHTLSLSVSPSVCRSDFMIKVIEVMDSSQQKTLRGHDAPVLSVAFDPSDEYIVSATDIVTAQYLFISLFISNDDHYLSGAFRSRLGLLTSLMLLSN